MKSVEYASSFQKIRKNKIILLFSILFLVTGCGPDDAGFLSSTEEDGNKSSSSRNSKDVNVRIVVDVNKQKGDRKKDKPWLPPATKSPPSDSDGGDDGDSRTPPIHPESKYREKGKTSLVKMDIFFYLAHKDDGKCWSRFDRSTKESGFFSHIEGFNWQASVAFYSHKPKLYRFRKYHSLYLHQPGVSLWDDGPIYVLNKDLFSISESNKYLRATISTEYVRHIPDHYESGRGGTKWPGEPQFPGHWGWKPRQIPTDPLFGLKRLLKENPETFIRKNSKSFIVLFEFDNYHYTAAEWRKFTEKYTGIHFIALASRRGMVSNLPHSSLGLKWIPCSYTHLSQRLAEHIRKIALE